MQRREFLGRLKEVVTPEIVDKIHGMILDDRRMKMREVAEAVGISTERLNHILHEYLDMKKLSARWVPRLLILAHHARVHRCVVTMTKIHKLGYELLPHLAYSPDLASCDYFLFPNLKKRPGGKRLRSNEEVITKTNAYFEGTYYLEAIKKIGKTLDQIELKRDALFAKKKYLLFKKSLKYLSNCPRIFKHSYPGSHPRNHNN